MEPRAHVRPVVLAGGRGTRLRPRTRHIPKPLLLVDGRPLLWYAITSCAKCDDLLPPIVVVSYKGKLVKDLFYDHDVEFLAVSRTTMLEAFLRATEECVPAAAYLCLSSDVVLSQDAIGVAVRCFTRSNSDNLIVLTENVHNETQKKWHYIIEENRLVDLNINTHMKPTNVERVALIVTNDSVNKVRENLRRPVRQRILPNRLHGFRTGWTLLVKLLLEADAQVKVLRSNVPVANVNQSEDLQAATSIVRSW